MKREGAIQMNRAIQSPSRRFLKLSVAVFGLCSLAVLNTDFTSSGRRALTASTESVRILCKTVFNYPDWSAHWEEIFPADKVYDGSGDQRKTLSKDPNNIGYFLTLMSCPGDGYKYGVDTQFDPGRALYDAAAVLKYSITRNTYPAGSKYNATMYAFVHPNAIVCKTPNDEEYDRVRVLQDLGYIVSILGAPFPPTAVEDSYLRENVPTDTGDRDFTRLFSLTFDNHPLVVMVDFTTLMMQPIDQIYDGILNSDSTISGHSMDYPDDQPGGSGLNMNFLIMKPNPDMFDTIVDEYTSAVFSPKWGYNYKGIKDFKGVFGVKGYMTHYLNRVESERSYILPRCLYGNDNRDPYITDADNKAVCRDPWDCSDCRETPLGDIKILKIILTCGEPWKCSWDDAWDAKTRSRCEDFHRSWFSARIDFETTCWEGGPPSARTGKFHEDVFMGFCSGPGVDGYDRMLDDKPATN